jgi:hypothetical protein
MLAWLTQHDYEFITDREVQRAAKSPGVKLPDGLVRLRGSDAPWVFVEVEFSKKTGGWAERQARAMAQALREEFCIADRWAVRGAWLITTTRADSPTPEAMAQRIAAFASRTLRMQTFVAQVDECGKPLDIAPSHVIIEPALDARPVKLHYLQYGEHYLDTMRAIEIEDAQALAPPVRPREVVVARGSFGSFGIEVSVRWPQGRNYTEHFATLTLQGQPIAVSELAQGAALTPLMRERIAMIQQWGFADGDDGDNGPDYVVYGLVTAGRPELIRELPELQRWVRSSGKSVEQIAHDYGLIVKRDQQRW